jgi:hypothetical protein
MTHKLVMDQNTKVYRFVLALLTVWRITHLLQAEDGPWDVVVHLRMAAGNGFWGKLLDCFYCLSVWMAAPLAFLLGESWWERALLWPSLSAGASLLEQATNPALRIPPAPFTEDPAVKESTEGDVTTETQRTRS